MSIIILHDYFESLEGGGRLSSLLAQQLDGTLGFGFARQAHPFLHNISPTKLYSLNAYSSIPLWRQFKLSRAFAKKTAFLANYHTVIYSGFYTPLAVTHHKVGRNILYCHTPPRFIYDQRDFYLQQLPSWQRPVLQAFIDYLQPRYETAIQRMDHIIANSNNVKTRIQQFLKQTAVVIYPPCEVEKYLWLGQEDYYLSTARLDPLKQVDKIIQAFLQLPDKKLIVASGGTELKRLQQIANRAPNIHFTNWVSDAQLQQLIGHAIATIYVAQAEDFGMSPVESMAAGKPVIGLAEGGLLETIIHEKTGLLLKSPLQVEELCTAVEKLTPEYSLAMRTHCEQQAQQFNLSHFMEQMRIVLSI